MSLLGLLRRLFAVRPHRWQVDYDDRTQESHVRPLSDGIDHLPSDECPCGPVTEPVPRPDGSVGWLVSHRSFDGREMDEPDRRV